MPLVNVIDNSGSQDAYEYPTYVVLLMRDRNTQRVYRLYDFSKAQLIRPDVAYQVAGKVNSADKLYLVIESVRLDTKRDKTAKIAVVLNRR
jgi:hypothetical protein